MTTSEDPPPPPSPAEDTPAPLASLDARPARSFHAGEVLFREGEPGTEAYLLDEGRVRLTKRVRGAERSLMVLKAGDLFGESALIAGVARSSTAVALTAGAALVIDRQALAELLQHQPSVAARLVQQLVQRLRDAEDQIEIMMLADTQSKVVSALLKLAQQARDAAATGPGATFIISPMELSTRIGVDVDAVKRAVQQLREGQYLKVSDERLEVPDLESMRRLSGLLGVKDEIRGEG